MPPGPVLSVEQSKQLITNVTALAAQGPLTPRQQADLDQAKRVVAQDTVNRLQSQTATLSEAQKQELAEAQGVLDGQGSRGVSGNADSGSAASKDTAPSVHWLVPKQPQHLEPTMPYDASRKPSGPPKTLSPGGTNPGHVRGFNAENEAAKVLAQHGYDYRQISEANSSPDGRVGGIPDIWDVFAPAATKSMKGIHDVVTSKVQVQNAPYVIVRIEAGGQDISQIKEYFRNNPVEGLKQLFIIKDGQLYIVR